MEGPPADGSESYKDSEVSLKRANRTQSEERTCRIPDVMEWNAQDAGEGKREPECSLPRVLK